ncbi:MAG: hypothetical protein Q9210_005246, partial [Variospora velana]
MTIVDETSITKCNRKWCLSCNYQQVRPGIDKQGSPPFFASAHGPPALDSGHDFVEARSARTQVLGSPSRSASFDLHSTYTIPYLPNQPQLPYKPSRPYWLETTLETSRSRRRSLESGFHKSCSHRTLEVTIAILAGLDLDGPADLEAGPVHTRRRRLGGDVCTIFVHAGAGYHSVQNERVHLQACENAAKAAMTLLSEGGGAVDAVEMAIMVLEQQEITNAGYGSNLSLDGTVECDATIVDHCGRSGAVGAVGQIQHPIHLARLILDYSTKPLSLRRVPPNLLAGPGATDFAESLQLPILPHDSLISDAARARWQKWARDLRAADLRSEQESDEFEETVAPADPAGDYQQIEHSPYDRRTTQADSTGKFATESLQAGPVPLGYPQRTYNPEQQQWSMLNGSVVIDKEATPPAGRLYIDAAITPTTPHVKWAGQWRHHDGEPKKDPRDHQSSNFVDDKPPMTRPVPATTTNTSTALVDMQEMDGDRSFTLAANPTPVLENTHVLHGDFPLHAPRPFSIGNDAAGSESVSLNDDITDTVGAIAVDCRGNIAAGSSSGGIGMKHRGRIGPAALVGVGTAVVPVDTDDAEKTSVATVTSGTGEHMATTMAANVCANRLYSGTRKGKHGGSESTDDDSAVKSFVERDFMDHPSVKTSYSTGAIGVLGIKKTTDGVWLYFAHNTDSFAMASMSSEESKPRSVMSRSKESGKVVSGGRSLKYRRVTSWPPGHHSGWPTTAEASPSPEQPTKRQKRKRIPPTGLPPDPDTEKNPSNISYKAVYEAKMQEIYGSESDIGDELAKVPPADLVRQKRHHQVLQQALGVVDVHEDATRGVGRLLEEDGVAGEFGHVDGDGEALAGEDGVGEGDVLRGEGAGGGEDQDVG